jgi:hypothetical protein
MTNGRCVMTSIEDNLCRAVDDALPGAAVRAAKVARNGSPLQRIARPAEREKAAPHGLLEQLAHMERNMTIHLESVRAVRSAAEPLVATLTPEQKKVFEETMTGLMGFGMGMGKM